MVDGSPPAREVTTRIGETVRISRRAKYTHTLFYRPSFKHSLSPRAVPSEILHTVGTPPSWEVGKKILQLPCCSTWRRSAPQLKRAVP